MPFVSFWSDKWQDSRQTVHYELINLKTTTVKLQFKAIQDPEMTAPIKSGHELEVQKTMREKN